MEGEEDALDDNDSDCSTLPIARRRREASDDEDDGGIECEDSARLRKIEPGFCFGSGSDSDSLGEAELYDDEESYTEEEYVDEVAVLAELLESDVEQTRLHGDCKRNEEKMNMEPLLDPKFGSFYFHDDRFRDTGDRDPRRRVRNGSKLWETSDEQKWVHDKFEEMMQQDRQHQEFDVRTISASYSQDNSKNQGHGSSSVKRTMYRPHENSDNQDTASKVVRRRGPVKYKSLTRSKSIIPSTKSKQSLCPCPPRSGQSLEMASNAVSKGVLLHASDLRSVPPASMKCVSASSSSSALLYPDGSTSHLLVTQKKDAKPEGTGRSHQGNTVVYPTDPNKLHFKSVHPASRHCLTNLSSHSYVSLPAYTGVSSLSLDQGRHLSIRPRPLQGTVRSSLRRPVQKSSQHSEFAFQTPSEVFAVSSSEPGALVSLPGGKSKHARDGKGSGTVQVNERDDLERGSQKFPSTPAKFPVMQFYDQHHGALGSPPVCACLPCYAFLSTHGIGNYEMAQLPVLVGDMGGLDSACFSSHIAAHPVRQASTVGVSGKEVGTNMASAGRVSRGESDQFCRAYESESMATKIQTPEIFKNELSQAKWIGEDLYT